jgi:hypothetical protein
MFSRAVPKSVFSHAPAIASPASTASSVALIDIGLEGGVEAVDYASLKFTQADRPRPPSDTTVEAMIRTTYGRRRNFGRRRKMLT